MTLPDKVQWKVASRQDVATLKNKIVYTLMSVTSVLTGHTVIGSRWIYRIKADNLHNTVALGWG